MTPTPNNEALAARLRDACTKLRVSSMPLADMIPLMQQAADALSTPSPEARETAEPRKETQSVQTSGSFTARDGVLLYGLRLTFDEWQAKHGPNGGAYDIEQQRAGWNGALASAGVEEFPLPDSQAARDVLAERQRQIEKEGWTPEHDDEHDDGVMALAAAGYAHAAFWNAFKPDEAFTADDPPPGWPEEWDFKPADPRRMLVKACALALAEIERKDRAARTSHEEKGQG